MISGGQVGHTRSFIRSVTGSESHSHCWLVMRERPLQFLFAVAALSFVTGIGLGISVISEFLLTGAVPRSPPRCSRPV
jgi:hypothetical protein